MPVDFGPKVVAAGLPGSDFAAHGLDAVDAPVQALADHDVDLNLGRVQPAAVLGGCGQTRNGPTAPCVRLDVASDFPRIIRTAMIFHAQKTSFRLQKTYSRILQVALIVCTQFQVRIFHACSLKVGACMRSVLD